MMKDQLGRIVIFVLFALIIGVPFLMRPAGDAAEVGSDAGEKLVIFSPHNEQIRHEFSRGFNEWRKRQGKSPIVFDWRTSGGTSDLRKQVLNELSAEYRAALSEEREPKSLGYDLFFGGGAYDHNKLASGVKLPPAEEGGEPLVIPASDPIDLSDKLIAEVFPSQTIGGEPLYREDKRWMGTALSSFGIVFNRDVHRMPPFEGLAEPETWADLQDARYFNWIALADPAHSGSIATTYNAILKRMGWTDGWAMLRRVFANSRYFSASSSSVPVDVSAGEAVAGMCIDFYGRFQAGAIQDIDSSSPRVGYVDPPYMTEMSADPISLMHMAPNRELATEFIKWVLSKEAQRLWQRRKGTEGGPERFELRRLPVRRDLYAPGEMQRWVDSDVNPFEIAKPYAPGIVDFRASVGALSHAMAIDIHDDLAAAWKAIIDNPGHRNIGKMRTLFDAMPDDLTLRWLDANGQEDADLAANWRTIIEDPDHPRFKEANDALSHFMAGVKANVGDPKTALASRLRWTAFFRSKYREIVRLSAE